jgi:hypothetical protein
MSVVGCLIFWNLLGGRRLAGGGPRRSKRGSSLSSRRRQAPAVTHATARGVCWVHGHGPQLPKGLTLTANSVQNNTLMAVHAQ